MSLKRERFFLIVVLGLWLETTLALGRGNTWNILEYIGGKREENLGMSLKNYCESWRLNVEINNIRKFDRVPGECVEFVSKYMSSAQYKADVQRAADESASFLTENFVPGGGGKDAWIFDVDDTLLSNAPYYKKNNFGALLGCSAVEANSSSLEKWMMQQNAPAIEQMRSLYQDIKHRGLKIFIISSRKERLRDATESNLVKAGYLGWTELILRCDNDGYDEVKKYKAEQRMKLISQGYRLWGIVGDQWSSFSGHPHAKRAFKVPNPMYYVS